MTTNDAPPSVTELGDADLVLRTRSGDTAAFGELWRRHYRSGITVARSVTSTLDPDDLVQESYTRIYQSILKGGGPTGSFRAYLFTSIRNTAAGWGRARRESAIDELDALEDPTTTEGATAEALDRGLTHQAFRSLPTRWQEVLWYSEIEQLKPAEIAPLLGMKATAVAQLAFRAREGLREAWIQAHVRSVEAGSECQWTIERLGGYARGNLGRRDHAKLEAHLEECTRCAIVASEAKEVSHRLALVLLPLTIGVAGAGTYLASLQGAATPGLALAAMPSGVVEGAVTVGSGAGAGVGAAGLVGTSAPGASGTSGGGFGGTALTIGLVAAGVLVVGGIFAAALVLPALSEPATEAGRSSDTRPAPELVTEAPTVAPQSPETILDPVTDPSDELAPPTVDEPITPVTTPLTTPLAPPPPTSSVDPVVPVEPVVPVPPTDPVLPAGTPGILSIVASSSSHQFQQSFSVGLSGPAGATVEVAVRGAVIGSVVLDAAGQGTLTFAPHISDVASNQTAEVRFVAGGQTGTPVTLNLRDLL